MFQRFSGSRPGYCGRSGVIGLVALLAGCVPINPPQEAQIIRTPYHFQVANFTDARIDTNTELPPNGYPLEQTEFLTQLVSSLNQELFQQIPARLNVTLRNYKTQKDQLYFRLDVAVGLAATDAKGRPLAQGSYACSKAKREDFELHRIVDQSVKNRAFTADVGKVTIWKDLYRLCMDDIANRFSAALINRGTQK